MHTQITARHFEADSHLRTYVQERLEKLERYYDGITDAHVILSVDGTPSADKDAEITLNVYQQRLHAQDAAASHEKAIDQCIRRLQRQVKRYKAKLRSTDKDYIR